MEKKQIIEKIAASRIMPIYSHENAETVNAVLKASYDAGLKSFEFTNRVKNAEKIFGEMIVQRAGYPELILGVGTVMNAKDAKTFINAGADFIVSPILSEEVGTVCKEHNITWIPGCGTPTEIIKARDLGADFIKIFPASTYGPSFISSVLSIAPDLKLIVTGGIEPNNEGITAWFKSGAICIGFGSNLLRKDVIAAAQWNLLRDNFRNTLTLANKAPAK